MTELEKVIKGLEHHREGECVFPNQEVCPYWGDRNCQKTLDGDALRLLNERRPDRCIICPHCGRKVVEE